ncbi:MAG: energy-coupling factor transporter transmembrane component T, partial [Candidatus Woesearchaeota archaeon]|nr:energy-coupling factor transporter transmembrane component T [Candidatus Woesearchaeota archaeon]
TIAIRFVPVIIREINHVIDAQKARAHKIIISLRHPAQSLATTLPIVIPTFHLLLIKAFDLSLAIEARGFQVSAPRTFPPRLKFKLQDCVAILLLLGVTIGLRFIR